MRITTDINNETMLKLKKRAARIGITPAEAARVIATKGSAFFLGLLVGATKKRKG